MTCSTPARSRIAARLLWMIGALLLLSGATACRRGSSNNTQGSAAASAQAPSDALPALLLKDDTANLMLTWVDEQGDFHVVQKISEVPEDRRDPVRVVVMGQEAGTGQYVYVANLKTKSPDGAYPVKPLSREQWDLIGADRRKARLEAMAPKAEPVASAQPPLAPGEKMHAIIYGADWCKPCHQAEDLLRSLGVDVTKKNIEHSEAAQAEMQQKLAKVHRTGSSIPVIDLMGNILVGFNADVLKRLVEQGRAREPAPNQGSPQKTL
jgi:glutaredoxin